MLVVRDEERMRQAALHRKGVHAPVQAVVDRAGDPDVGHRHEAVAHVEQPVAGAAALRHVDRAGEAKRRQRELRQHGALRDPHLRP